MFACSSELWVSGGCQVALGKASATILGISAQCPTFPEPVPGFPVTPASEAESRVENPVPRPVLSG